MKTILVDAVYTFIIEQERKWVVFEDMHKLLQTYPNKKLVLTNAPEEKFELYGLNNLPYEFFTLSRNPEKSNPEYFKILLEKFSLEAQDVIYFEHSEDAVKSARSVGINTYFYDNEKKDLTGLKKFLDENL
jgi:HAD superfamily hydrolase (TIGR01509 family)